MLVIDTCSRDRAILASAAGRRSSGKGVTAHMCGVVAVAPANQPMAAQAMRSMRNRGPDDFGLVDTGFASLGVARLAITDIAHGHQPFRAPSGRAWIGFNGAIYNAQALIQSFDMRPASGNDGEVIGYLYEQFGLRFADYLEGMYAICIADADRSQLVVAVDPIGIKPLYLAATETSWLAASTLQAFPRELRRLAWRIPPGTVWTSAGATAAITPRTTVDGSLRALLEASVQEQIPAEVPWGCMLSGGVDSSVVAALAARQGPTLTFTSGLPGSQDLAAAAEVADFLGTVHRQEIIDRDELPLLVDAAVRATASPDPVTILAGIGTYAAARAAAREGVKVLLSGEGADELFGGYEDYLQDPPELREASLLHDQVDLGARECLRLDRCTMAHGIEARVPFLSSSVIGKARALPLTEKIDTSGAVPVQKAVLRRLAGDLLPARSAARPKVGFPDGAGLTQAVREEAHRSVSSDELAEFDNCAVTFSYLKSQRELGVDNTTAAYTWKIWSRYYSDVADGWSDMAERGLVRRSFSEGTYTPPSPPAMMSAAGESERMSCGRSGTVLDVGVRGVGPFPCR